MTEAEINIESRLHRIEASNRRLRYALLAVTTAGIAALVAGSSPPRPKVVDAERFVVRDDQGRARAELGLEEGSATLVLRDLTSEGQIIVSVSDRGSAVLGMRTKDRQEVEILALSGGGSGLAIRDRNREYRVELGNRADGSPHFVLSDEAGKELFRAPGEAKRQ